MRFGDGVVMRPEPELVGQREKNGARYEARVERTYSSNPPYNWEVWRSNPQGTIPTSSIVARGPAQSYEEAKRKALAALGEV
jgi:hypothetical protein